jgi:hypothetical protein
MVLESVTSPAAGSAQPAAERSAVQ